MRYLLLLALLPLSAGAQTVYKCKDPDGGTIYSQQPCAEDPAKVEQKEVKWAGQADPDAVAAHEAMTKAAGFDRAERECVSRAEGRIYADADWRIAAHTRRIQALEANIRRAANNLAGATWEAGMREEIAGLHLAISEERTNASRLVNAERDRCAEERRRREAD